jgi:hypothetical protein
MSGQQYQRTIKGGQGTKAPTYAGSGKGSHWLGYCTQPYLVFYTRGCFKDKHQYTMGTFGLSLFWAYEKQLMQINKLLCIIQKFLNIVYEKQFINIQFPSVRT